MKKKILVGTVLAAVTTVVAAGKIAFAVEATNFTVAKSGFAASKTRLRSCLSLRREDNPRACENSRDGPQNSNASTFFFQIA